MDGILSGNFKIKVLDEILYSNGDRYKGMLENGKRNGKGKLWLRLGTMYYANGDRYEGDWKDDLRHGDGNNQ